MTDTRAFDASKYVIVRGFADHETVVYLRNTYLSDQRDVRISARKGSHSS